LRQDKVNPRLAQILIAVFKFNDEDSCETFLLCHVVLAAFIRVAIEMLFNKKSRDLDQLLTHGEH